VLLIQIMSYRVRHVGEKNRAEMDYNALKCLIMYHDALRADNSLWRRWGRVLTCCSVMEKEY
jgi:hypothetical protein